MSDLLIHAPFDLERDDWGTQLLREWTTDFVQPGWEVLIVGAGAGGSGLALARTGAHITFVDDQVAALDAARKTFTQAGATATFCTSAEFAPTQAFDLALVNILWWTDAERGGELLDIAVQQLKPGQLLVVAGGKSAGIRSVEDTLNSRVGPTSTLIYKKGHRLLATQRPAHWQPQPPQIGRSDVQVAGFSFTLEQRAGVFAGGTLDPASVMLSEALRVPAAAQLLDLGCGSGIIAMAAARKTPSAQLTLVDSNVQAVLTAQHNLAANQIDGRVLASDGVAAVAGEQFDMIVSNPPFHMGRIRTEQVARRFIAEAWSVAAPGGTLWLVANRFLRYEPTIQDVWGNVREVTGDGRYKVLYAQRHGS